MNEDSENSTPVAGPGRSKTFARMTMEVFSIVLGVLLALGVSEWQEEKNNQERAALALGNVRAELQSNLDLLNIINPNNARVVSGITASDGEGEQDETIVPGVQMRSSAWQTLSATGLSNYVNYEVLIELSQLYAMIDVYRQTAYQFIGSNMNLSSMATAMGSSVDNQLFAENFLSYFQMLVQIEEALIQAHESAIDKIDSSL